MTKPRIRHIALNVQNRDELADYYKKIFGLEEKHPGPNGTVYLFNRFDVPGPRAATWSRPQPALPDTIRKSRLLASPLLLLGTLSAVRSLTPQSEAGGG